MSRYAKQVLPVPNRADPLWRHCIFAAAPGWQKGYAQGSKETWNEDITKARAAINGSVNGTTDTDWLGWAASAGSSLDIQEVDDITDLYDQTANALSATVLFHILDDPDTAAILCKRTGLGASATGWSIQNLAGSNTFRFELSDGGSQESDDYGSYNLGDHQHHTAILGTDLEAQIFSQGALESTATFTLKGDDTNNNDSVKILGDDSGPNDQIDGLVSMCAFWDRQLTEAEQRRLYVDPYVMWRHIHKDFMFGPGEALASGYNTYFLNM